MADESAYVEVEVEGVVRDLQDKSMVLLRDGQGRQLRIWIGQCEALAIAQRLEEAFEPQRPLTQDMLLQVWKKLDAELLQLRIDDLWEMIYYSKLVVNQRGAEVLVDCRPSDGIAVALAAKAPIFVSEEVMASAGQSEQEE